MQGQQNKIRQTVLVVNAATTTLRFGVANLERRNYIKTFSITGIYLFTSEAAHYIPLFNNKCLRLKTLVPHVSVCLSCAVVGTQTPHRQCKANAYLGSRSVKCKR
jgi:hypothetical protein